MAVGPGAGDGTQTQAPVGAALVVHEDLLAFPRPCKWQRKGRTRRSFLVRQEDRYFFSASFTSPTVECTAPFALSILPSA